MIKIFKRNSIRIFKLLAVIIILAFFSILVSDWLRSEAIQLKIDELGILAPLIVILYTVISHVVAPVAGTPGIVVSFAAFGLVQGGILIYIASLISAILNFYIARYLGRRWVEKLSGGDSIERIDKFVEIMGVKILIIARLFGSPLYEFISYAAGLTKIDFKRYIVITALLIPIPSVIYSIFIYYSLSSPFRMALFYAVMIVAGAMFSLYIVRQYVKIKRSEN